MKKYRQNYVLFTIFIIFIILCIVYYNYYSIESNENIIQITDNNYNYVKRNINNDGYVILYNNNYANTNDYPTQLLQNDVLSILPDGYQFIDYVYKIKNTALNTFHRDVTSSQYIYKTKYPVYTLILYKNDGELLSVCPGSNKTYPFVWSNIVNIHGKTGTAILFDCELLHAGCDNYCKERNVIQYKLCHTEDIYKLQHLNGVKIEKIGKCANSLYNTLMRKISYFFEMPINYILYPFMIQRESNDSLVGKIQSIIPLNYYNNI